VVNEEAGVAAEATEMAGTMIDDSREAQYLPLRDVEAHHPVMTSEDLLHAETWIRTSLADAVPMIDAADQPLPEDLSLAPGHHLDEDTAPMKKAPLPDDDATLPADRGPLHLEFQEKMEREGCLDAVIVERDPSHLQIPLAHVRLEEAADGVPLPFLAALHPLRETDAVTDPVLHHQHLVLAQ